MAVPDNRRTEDPQSDQTILNNASHSNESLLEETLLEKTQETPCIVLSAGFAESERASIIPEKIKITLNGRKVAADILKKLMGGLFGLGVALTIISFVPVLPLAALHIAPLISSIMQLGGYGFWVTSSVISTNRIDIAKKNWRMTYCQNVTQKENHLLTSIRYEKYAALLGACASVLAIVAVFVPPLIIASCIGLWLASMSNVLWLRGTMNLLKEEKNQLAMPDDLKLARVKQLSYQRNFVITLVILSIFMALALSATIFCPPVAAVLAFALLKVLSIKTLAIAGLFAAASYYFLKTNVGSPKAIWNKFCSFWNSPQTDISQNANNGVLANRETDNSGMMGLSSI